MSDPASGKKPRSDPSPDPPFAAMPEGLRLAVRATPKAKANRIDGIHPGPDRSSLLKVSVTAAPEKGKANAAIIKLLAKQWGLAKSSFDIINGEAARDKTFLIQGDAIALKRCLLAWCRANGHL